MSLLSFKIIQILIFSTFHFKCILTRHVSKSQNNSETKQDQHSWYVFLLAGCVAGILGTAMGIMVIALKRSRAEINLSYYIKSEENIANNEKKQNETSENSDENKNEPKTQSAITDENIRQSTHGYDNSINLV